MLRQGEVAGLAGGARGARLGGDDVRMTAAGAQTLAPLRCKECQESVSRCARVQLCTRATVQAGDWHPRPVKP